MEMIDWWPVPGHMWGVRNLDFKVELLPDESARPDPLDYYSERDEELLKSGDWQYVTVQVTPMDASLVDHVEARQSLDHIEWGQFASIRIDREDLLDGPVRALAGEAVLKLLRDGFPLEVAEDSEFTLEKLMAPF